jgi:two-component system, chemotaxis family, sensor kinase Cph1
MRSLAGFDRVMIYQFNAEAAGEVIAEAKREDLLPYLGLHYPATDIPDQPRQLYRQGLLRYIPDLNAPVVEMVPAVHPVTQHPLDLSFVTLRGTDPCCVAYHQNMGVAALMVMALIKDQQLWGLIACHHQTPKFVSPQVRMVCEVLGQFIAAELANQINSEALTQIMKLKSLQSELVESIAQAADLKTALVQPAPHILNIVNAQGAAVCLEDEITLMGATPSLEQVQDLIQWSETEVSESIFHTHALPKLYAAAAAYKDEAAGLLLLRISQVRRYYMLWFRPEVLQTVNWAGDPHASIQAGADGQVVLSPRRSFDQWQETVRLTSLPWQASELNNALDLRTAIVGIVLNKADELARMNQALARSNQELESFAYAASHDLKEPLRGIHNYATFLIEDYQEILDEAGTDRLRTLVKLTQRMESLIDVLLKFSQLGQTELNRQPTDLNDLLRQVINVFQISQPHAAIEIRIPRPLPLVQVDPVLVNEVFSNLLSNASKYNDKAQPWIEISYLDADQPIDEALPFSQHRPSTPIFYVRDNGIGIRERHLETIFRLFKRLHPQTMYGGGTGAGLTIAKKIVERHNGQIWVTSSPGAGTTFYLTLE